MRMNKNLYSKIVANENIYNKEIGYKLGVELVSPDYYPKEIQNDFLFPSLMRINNCS